MRRGRRIAAEDRPIEDARIIARRAGVRARAARVELIADAWRKIRRLALLVEDAERALRDARAR